MAEQTLPFQAEVARLLDIVANALYSDKEIFLRELISNAADACDKLRYAALTEPELVAGDAEFCIRLAVDKKAKTLTVADNGIGMSREELVDNLGTIARSGTSAFLDQMQDANADADAATTKKGAKRKKPAGKSDGGALDLIGQFGVGFYSGFMVADCIEATSRRAGEAKTFRWRSTGAGEFSVAEVTGDEAMASRGTRIVLSLKKTEAEYLEPARLREIVKAHSDHIAVPIHLADPAKGSGTDADEASEEAPINQASALWTRPKSEIDDEQYSEFYHHVAHAFDEPWLTLHYRAEGKIEYTGLLFVPGARPFDLFHPERHTRVKLYIKRVFISDECDALMPAWLRFLRGIVDTPDLALNINRQTLQDNPLIAKIRLGLTKRVLRELKKKADKDADAYATFWENFGAVLKEGLYEPNEHREALLGLARFRSTGQDALTDLAGYVERMKDGQGEIYYISGEEAAALATSPQLEGFKAKGIEVLLMTDPVDEFWLPSVEKFDDKPFRSVTRGGLDLDAIDAGDKDKKKAKDEAKASPKVDALIATIKLALKDAVKDVRASKRLTDSPVCLVSEEGDLDINLERLLRQHKEIQESIPRILEINPTHPLIVALAGTVDAADQAQTVDDAAFLLLDQARILEGEALPDPAGFVKRMSAVMRRASGG